MAWHDALLHVDFDKSFESKCALELSSEFGNEFNAIIEKHFFFFYLLVACIILSNDITTTKHQYHYYYLDQNYILVV